MLSCILNNEWYTRDEFGHLTRDVFNNSTHVKYSALEWDKFVIKPVRWCVNMDQEIWMCIFGHNFLIICQIFKLFFFSNFQVKKSFILTWSHTIWTPKIERYPSFPVFILKWILSSPHRIIITIFWECMEGRTDAGEDHIMSVIQLSNKS